MRHGSYEWYFFFFFDCHGLDLAAYLDSELILNVRALKQLIEFSELGHILLQGHYIYTDQHKTETRTCVSRGFEPAVPDP
jgi:hypothetical protein